MYPASLEVEGLPLVTVRRGEGAPARIYIEGDGRAFISRSQPSNDPTPTDPVALRLMLADGGDAMFVGRPCQWVRGEACKRGFKVWTLERFTARVVDAYVKLVEQETRGRPVELVGYSGGAWVALQVAARLPNVTAVRTVAGNVDPAAVNAHHKVTKMEVAPWPEGYGRLPEVAQLHLVGTEDRTVPEKITRDFLARVNPDCARVVTVEASHYEGWVERAGMVTGGAACAPKGEGPR